MKRGWKVVEDYGLTWKGVCPYCGQTTFWVVAEFSRSGDRLIVCIHCGH